MLKDHLIKIQNGECSTIELVLTAVCIFLLGVVIGMKIAPARIASYGSFNGNQGSIEKLDDLKDEIKNELKK